MHSQKKADLKSVTEEENGISCPFCRLSSAMADFFDVPCICLTHCVPFGTRDPIYTWNLQPQIILGKPTHIDLYLNSCSHHQPAHKGAVLSTLVHWAYSVLDLESLPGELEYLRRTFLQNGDGDGEVPEHCVRDVKDEGDEKGLAIIPFLITQIRRVLLNS